MLDVVLLPANRIEAVARDFQGIFLRDSGGIVPCDPLVREIPERRLRVVLAERLHALRIFRIQRKENYGIPESQHLGCVYRLRILLQELRSRLEARLLQGLCI